MNRVYKTLIVLSLLLLACNTNRPVQQSVHAASLQQMRFHCNSDTTRINQLLQLGFDSGITQAGDLVLFYAKQLLETPYVAHTLEGDQEWLTINIHELDCTTFIETLYALTRATLDRRYSWRDYADNLQSIRYRGGELGDYSSRLHYISDWAIDNRTRGNLQEVTPDIPHATSMIKNIDYMSQHRESYPQIKDDDTLYNRIRNFEIGYRNHRIPYVKRTWLNDKNVKQALHNGDFIGLVTTVPGLDVSHLGIVVFDDKQQPHLLDASMTHGKVLIEAKPLYKYLAGSKTVIGIRVFRIMQ